MTREMKAVRSKMDLLELAEYLQNVSEACRVMGVSRQHFYDIKQAYEEGGAEALRGKSRRKPFGTRASGGLYQESVPPVYTANCLPLTPPPTPDAPKPDSARQRRPR